MAPKERPIKNIPVQQLLEDEEDDFSDVVEEMQKSIPVLDAGGNITDLVHPDDFEEGDYEGSPTEAVPQAPAPGGNSQESPTLTVQPPAEPGEVSGQKTLPVGIPISSLKMPEVAPQNITPLPAELWPGHQGAEPRVYIGAPQTLYSPLADMAPVGIDECVFEFRHGFLYGAHPKKAEIKLSSLFRISNLVVDETGIPFAVLVHILASSGAPRDVAIRLVDLTMQEKEAIRVLMQNGLWVSPHPDAKNMLSRFISHVSRDAPRIQGTTRTGFHWTGGQAYFVLPGRTIPSLPGSPVFIHEGHQAITYVHQPTCYLATWQNRIGDYCRGNPFLIFPIAVALTSPWLRYFNVQGAGFHFWGRSSTGKSTIAYVMASIMLGRFEDFFRNWNATANGMEAVCKMSDGSCLVLDELGECSAKDANRAIYMISNGRPKKRYTDADASQVQWQLMYASTGELSSKAHLELGRIMQKPGQAIRRLDIPVETENGMGVFHFVPEGWSPAEFSQYLRDQSLQCRGAVQEAYLTAMLTNFPAARQSVEDMMAQFGVMCAPDPEGQVQRAHRLFALCAAAGEFGISQGILPWSHGDALKAAHYTYEAWRSSFYENSMPEAERIMERLHSTLMRQGESGFLKCQKMNGVGNLGNAFGFRQEFPDGSAHYILPADGFARMFRGFESRTVCTVLKQRGLLLTEKRNNAVKRPLPGNPNARCYVIRMAE